MKKIYPIFVLVLVLSMWLTACGDQAAPATPAANKAPVQTTKAPAAKAPTAEAPAASASWLENAMNNIPDQRVPSAEEAAVMDGDFQVVAGVLGLSGSGTAYNSMAPAGTSSEAVYQYFSKQSKATSFDSNTITPDGGTAESAIHYAVFPNPDGGNFIIVVTPLNTGVGIRALAIEGYASAPAAAEAAAPPASETAPEALEGAIYMPGASQATESEKSVIEPIINTIVPTFSGVAGENITGYDAYLMPAEITWENVVTFYNFPQAVNIDGFNDGVMAMVNGGGVTTPLPEKAVLIYIPLTDKVIVVIVYTE